MIKRKLIFIGVTFLLYSFLIMLGLSVINFLFKNDLFTDKPDFYKAIWIVITTTLFSTAIVFILRMKESKDVYDEDIKQQIEKLYTEKDFIWNRRVTMAYGITFLFLFFAVITSELLSFSLRKICCLRFSLHFIPQHLLDMLLHLGMFGKVKTILNIEVG